VVQYLVDHDPVERRVFEGQPVDPPEVERDPTLGLRARQLLSGDLEHAGVQVHRLDPTDVSQQRPGVAAGAAPGVQNPHPVQRHRRVGEAADDDLGPHGLPRFVVVPGLLRVVLVAAHPEPLLLSSRVNESPFYRVE
jgi:hypothetical protein